MKPAAFKPPFLRSLQLAQPEEINVWPFSIPLFTAGINLNFTHPITIIVGENGSGKSTLLEAIAAHCGFNLSGGNRNHIHTERNDLQPLINQLTLGWLPKVNQGFFFRAESFFNFASYVDNLKNECGGIAYQPYGGQSLHARSHGESFMALFESLQHVPGLFILDEPEAALSPERQILFLDYLHRMLEQGNAQVIMATHSPILMAYPGAQFLSVNEGRLTETSYRVTSHYQTYRRFLENPDAYLKPIFG